MVIGDSGRGGRRQRDSGTANVATRILGYVNAPSLMQKAVARCLDARADVPYYNRNRETLYNGLRELGFSCIKPQGAFYLFVKSPGRR